MMTNASRDARAHLRIALGLLDEDRSLTAVAMISGALEMLDEPALTTEAIGGMIRKGSPFCPSGTVSRSCA